MKDYFIYVGVFKIATIVAISCVPMEMIRNLCLHVCMTISAFHNSEENLTFPQKGVI